MAAPNILCDTAGMTNAQWLAARMHGPSGKIPYTVGGSDVAAVFGVSPWTTPLELWMIKKGRMKPPAKSNANQLEMGHLLEPIAAHWYAKKTGNRVYEDTNLYQHADHPYALANFDRRFERASDGEPGILECKSCTYHKASEWDDGAIPLYYELQLRFYLAVADVEIGAFSAIWGNNPDNDLAIPDITRDKAIPTPSVYLADVRGKYKTRSSWSYESVRNILTNRIYTGDTVPFKSHVVRVGSNHVRQVPVEMQQVIPNTHEAIISRETYYQALSTIKSVKKGRGTKSDNPFTSLLICGCCGNRLSKGKEANKNWRCSMHRYEPKTQCKDVVIDNDHLEQIVLRAITTQCRLLDAKIQSIKKESHVAKNSDQILRNECQTLQKQIDRIEADKMALYEKYVCGDIGKEIYTSEKSRLSEQEDKLKARYVMAEQRIALIREKIQVSKERIIGIEKVDPYQGVERLTPELTRELIKRIVVHPDKKIRIEWNFSDELSGLIEFPEIRLGKKAI